ncbi:MAG: D-alanyl-lipoteichoic acid biosynthesis protein DltD [Acutalibacteraceae bacterium]
MLNKTLKILGLIFIPICIVFFLTKHYSKYLDNYFNKNYNNSIEKAYGISEKNKGIKILNKASSENDILIFGSSELNNGDSSQSPANMFPNSKSPYDVCLVGEAGTQSLLHAIKIGAIDTDLSNRKIVFMVSPQWFFGDNIDDSAYRYNFSKLQFYKFMANSNINNSTKTKVCKRNAELLQNEISLNSEFLYSHLHSDKNFFSGIVSWMFKPYFLLYKKILELKDKHTTCHALKNFKDNSSSEIKSIDWQKEKNAVEEMGKIYYNSNDLKISDEYYFESLGGTTENLRGMYKDMKVLDSPEFTDFEIILEVFKDLKIKPYIIIVPANGYFYDIAELNQEKRFSLYDKVCSKIKKFGFDYLDLRNSEYEPYFFKDVIHLSPKGWLYVNEKITQHFS